MRGFVVRALFCALFSFCSGVADASPVNWALSALAPSATPVSGVGGTFTYDSETNQILSWNIHYGVTSDFGTIEHNPGPDFPVPSSFAAASNGATLLTFGQSRQSGFASAVTLELTAPLTDAGGTISLVAGRCSACMGPGYTGSDISGSGYLSLQAGGGIFYPFASGSIAAVPEPGLGLCIGLFVLALSRLRGCERLGRKLSADE